MLKKYLKKINETSSQGDAREESFYSTLEKLLMYYKNFKILYDKKSSLIVNLEEECQK